MHRFVSSLFKYLYRGNEKRTCYRNYLSYFIEEETHAQKVYLGLALSSRNIIQATCLDFLVATFF